MFLDGVDQLQVFLLDNTQAFGIVMGGWAVPVTLVKVLLQPDGIVKPLSVNGFDLSSEHGPFGAGVGAELFPGQGAVLVESHVPRLHGVMLARFSNPNDVEVPAFGIVERRVLKVRISLEPGAGLQKALDVRIFENAAVLAKDNSANKLQILQR